MQSHTQIAIEMLQQLVRLYFRFDILLFTPEV